MADKSKDKGKKKAIVIGAGVGGTATAARLAHAGLDVEVYEKNGFSGGRCSLIHHDGYRFDQGPSLFLLPPLFHQLYTDLGTTLAEHVELLQCHPNYVLHYHDGEKVVLSSDRAQLRQEVEKWEGPGGGDKLEAFLSEGATHASLSYSLVLSKAFPTLFHLLQPAFLKNFFNLHVLDSLYGRCAKYFATERMRRAFSFGSMYLGSSPFDSPGTYTLLQWTETCEGIWYPRGGFHSVPNSLVKIAESHGARFHYGSPVASVNYNTQGKATGITLESGQTHEADVVVCNADLVWAHNNLFKGERKEKMKDSRLARKLLEKPHSCSSISFYWAMDRQIPELNAHNIFLAEDYKGSFDDIFRRKSMPKEPSFYVNVPSRIDSTAAPEGKDALVVLVPVGHLLPTPEGQDGDALKTSDGSGATQDWPALVEQARRQVIETMESRLGIKGLRERITWEEVNTPITWKEKFNLAHGSILGITHDFFNVLSFRPQSRHPSIKGAYFVGASAHPGTGVPIAIAGSRLCAEAVLADLDIPLPECYTTQASFPVRQPTTDIDRPQGQWFRHTLENMVASAWNHMALLVILSLVGVLVTTQSGNTPALTSASKPATSSLAGQADRSSGWSDHLTTIGLLVAIVGIRLIRTSTTRATAPPAA